ncbi:MAG: hypothetical protein KKD77_20910 [Gammaproteobacteria bacterium]|nr:hypothetical protein [Gammaproteobacteria bacterium]
MGVIAADTRLATASRKIFYDTELQVRANIDDIYTMQKKGLYNRLNESFPMDSIFTRITDQSATEGVITLLENLALPGVYGQTMATGTEEAHATLSMHTYQDNYRKVIPYPGYGLQKLEADKYKLYDQNKPRLRLWNDEQEGLEIRQSKLETYGTNMAAATSNVFATIGGNINWNPHMLIPGLGNAVNPQPAFSTNRATYTNNICTGLMQTGGFGQFAARMLNAQVLEDISNSAIQLRLKDIAIPGLPTGRGYILTISELQAAYLSNPTVAANNLGSMYIAGSLLPPETKQRWRGVIAAYNNLLIIVDWRQPTLIPSGSAAPYGLTAGYMLWDSFDDRHRTNPHVKDTAFLYGAGELVSVEGEKLHWIDNTQDYGFREGIGTAGVRGYQLSIFRDVAGNIIADRGAVWILDMVNNGVQAGMTAVTQLP